MQARDLGEREGNAEFMAPVRIEAVVEPGKDANCKANNANVVRVEKNAKCGLDKAELRKWGMGLWNVTLENVDRSQCFDLH
jgi:hypothetical protein